VRSRVSAADLASTASNAFAWSGPVSSTSASSPWSAATAPLRRTTDHPRGRRRCTCARACLTRSPRRLGGLSGNGGSGAVNAHQRIAPSCSENVPVPLSTEQDNFAKTPGPTARPASVQLGTNGGRAWSSPRTTAWRSARRAPHDPARRSGARAASRLEQGRHLRPGAPSSAPGGPESSSPSGASSTTPTDPTPPRGDWTMEEAAMSYPGATGAVSAVLRSGDEVEQVRFAMSGTVARFVAPGSLTGGRYGLFEWNMQPHSGGSTAHFHRTFAEASTSCPGSCNSTTASGGHRPAPASSSPPRPSPPRPGPGR